jgi:hypothetical protein
MALSSVTAAAPRVRACGYLQQPASRQIPLPANETALARVMLGAWSSLAERRDEAGVLV